MVPPSGVCISLYSSSQSRCNYQSVFIFIISNVAYKDSSYPYQVIGTTGRHLTKAHFSSKRGKCFVNLLSTTSFIL